MYYIEINRHCFRYCQSYTDPLTGKKKTLSITRSDTLRRTQDEARRTLESKVEEATAVTKVPSDLTLQELTDIYVSERDDVRPQTQLSAKQHLTAVLRILGPDTRCDRLTAYYVNKQIATHDDTNSLRNGHVKALKSLLRWGHTAGYVKDISWLSAVRKYHDQVAVEKRQLKYLEKEEIQTLLEGMTVLPWKLLTEFLLLSGLRIGEALALTVGDYDIAEMVITVNKTYSPTLRRVMPTPKTDASVRQVSVQQELLCVITRVLKEKDKPWKDDQLLFAKKDGSPFCYESYDKYFRENCERLLHRRLSPHALRHTHVSLLAAAGVPLEVISRRIGHQSSDITRDIYLHVTSELRKKDSEMLSDLTLLDL